jgi:hypothetical protein
MLHKKDEIRKHFEDWIRDQDSEWIEANLDDFSKTTKDRMHSYLITNADYRLYQKKGAWILDQVDKNNDYRTIKTIPYENGMILQLSEGFINA